MKRLLFFVLTAALLLVMAGCGTSGNDALTGRSKSIGHQTSGYSIGGEHAEIVWTAVNPPSHVTLREGEFDVISPIQPSVMRLRVNPNADAEIPLDVFLSSSSDYHFESAKFSRSTNGSLLLEVSGFGADRSAVHASVLHKFYEQITMQVAEGSLTEREGLAALATVAAALAEIGMKAALPGL